jgi:hypothetical protein
MTIKITQVSTSTGEILLTIAYDNPKGSGKMFSFTMQKEQLFENLTEVYDLLGRQLTLTDAQQAIVAIINKVRQGQTGIPGNFDFTPYIGVELET